MTPYLEELIGQCVDLPAGLGTTFGFMASVDGEVIAEHYRGILPGSERVVSNDVPLLSWSMAKSVTQSLCGLAHDDGLIDIEQPAPVKEWANDERVNITLRHLLQMSSGLQWVEEYSPNQPSDVIEMLFGAAQGDAAAFARAKPLTEQPGTVNLYSSGTTNILCRILEDALQQHEGISLLDYLQQRLLDPIGASFDPGTDARRDAAGTWIGSSFLYLRAQDWLRFGLLYLNEGTVDGRTVLNPRWVTDARTKTTARSTDHYGYSNHWWLWPPSSATPDAFAACGYEGQHVIVVPSKRAVVVRLGSTPDSQKHLVRALLHRIIEAI